MSKYNRPMRKYKKSGPAGGFTPGSQAHVVKSHKRVIKGVAGREKTVKVRSYWRRAPKRNY